MLALSDLGCHHIFMNRQFTGETVEKVLGSVSHASGSRTRVIARIPLHINFDGMPSPLPSERLTRAETEDPVRFNAVGSRNLTAGGRGRLHLPVIDVDGGALMTSTGTEAMLNVSHPCVSGSSDTLRNLLGDHGIDLMVLGSHRRRLGSGIDPRAIVLISPQEDMLETVSSTREGRSHLYIQKVFTSGDHATLIQELGQLGIISPGWQAMTEEGGMGIVRTPWTTKAAHHVSSD